MPTVIADVLTPSGAVAIVERDGLDPLLRIGGAVAIGGRPGNAVKIVKENADAGRAKSPLPDLQKVEEGDSLQAAKRRIAELEEQQRQVLAQKRDRRRTVSLEQYVSILERSSARFDAALVGRHSSPSAHAQRRERTAVLADCLAREHGIEMPIAEQVDAILHRGQSPKDAIREIMDRPLKRE